MNKSLLTALALGLAAYTPLQAATPVPTTVTDGVLAPGTTWYTMQIAAAGFVLADNGSANWIALDTPSCKFTPSELWAFEGNATDGYTIYNMAQGTAKQLASPKTMSGTNGGDAYVVLKAPGDASYVYKWDLLPSTTTEGQWFITQHGVAANAINNRGSKLAFWTTGKDAGSSVAIEFGQTTMTVDLTAGQLHRDSATGATGQNWNAQWVSTSTDPQLTFGCAYNNMTAAGNNIAAAVGMNKSPYTFGLSGSTLYVESFEFDFANNTDHSEALTLTVGDKTWTSTAAKQHVACSGFTLSEAPSISLNGANKTIVLSDFTVTVKRTEETLPGYEVMTSTPGKVPYRIPAIAVVGKGERQNRLISVADYRHSGSDIGMGTGKIDLHISVSDDNGETWTAAGLLKDASGKAVTQASGDKSAFDCGFGDPCIVADRESQRVLMMSCAAYGGFFGSTRQAPQAVARWYSEDGGQTWSEAQNITEEIYSQFDDLTGGFGPIQGMFFGSGRIMQSVHIKVGDYYRLYSVMSGRNPNGITNWVMYSDDFGKTWAILGDPINPPVPTGGDEPKAEELADGSVVFSARVNGGAGRNFNIFRYSDVANGQGLWGDKVQVLLRGKSTNACNGEILILPAVDKATGEKTYLALQSLPFGPGRANVGIFWKNMAAHEDFGSPELLGADWDGEYQVSTKSSAYSTMVRDMDGNVAFLYEEDRYGSSYCIVFRSVSIADITDGAYEAADDDDLSVAHAIAAAAMTERAAAVEGAPAAMLDALKAAAAAYVAEPSVANMEAYYALENKINEIIATVGEMRKALGGKYVGQFAGETLAALNAAMEAYDAAPSAETYAAIEEALNAPNPQTLVLTDGQKYRIWHFDREAAGMLAGNVSNQCKGLSKAKETSDYTLFTVEAGTEPGTWYLSCKGAWLGSTGAVETIVPFVADKANAAVYTFEPDRTGRGALVCTTPTNASYPALHLSGDKTRVVPWTKPAGASQWYIAPEDPENSMSGVENVSVGNEPREVIYYDIYGRRAAALKPGNLYIGNDGTKIVVR